MNNALQTTEPNLSLVPADVSAGALQSALAGDLAKLSAEDRLKFYGALCDFTGLNPLSKPFDWIPFQGKLTLYPNKGCAEQLRKIHGITFDDNFVRTYEHGLLITTIRGQDKAGRRDFATAALPFDDRMTPDVRAIALMKCETKAKRRLTLSIVGLSMFARDVEDSDVAPVHEHGLTQIETASDRAAALNAAIGPIIDAETVAEKAEPKPEAKPEVKPEPEPKEMEPELPKAAETASAVTTGQQPAEPPVAAPSGSPALVIVANGLLTDEAVAQIQQVFMQGNPTDYMDYLVAKNRMKKGADLNTISESTAQTILKANSPIHRWVSDWKKTQPQPAKS